MKKFAILLVASLVVAVSLSNVFATTTDLTVGGTTGYSDRNAGKVYVVSAELDLSETNATTADVFQMINVPADTLVLAVSAVVKTAEGATLTFDVGDGTDADGWLDGVNGNSAATTYSGGEDALYGAVTWDPANLVAPLTGTVTWDPANLVAPLTGTVTWDPANLVAPLTGTVTWDPGSLIDAAGETKAVTVTGAAIGDYVVVSPPVDVVDMVVSATVIATDTVEIRLQNESGSTADLASGSWTVVVTPGTGATGESKDITVTGAALGDYVSVSAPVDTVDLAVSATVTAADTVTVRIENKSGAAVDLASGSWTAIVTPGTGATGESKDITVTGAALGDYVLVSPPVDAVDMLISATVTAADTVTVRIQNASGTAANLASGSWSVRVISKRPVYAVNGGKLYTSADTLDVTINNASADTAVIDIKAVLIDL